MISSVRQPWDPEVQSSTQQMDRQHLWTEERKWGLETA
jgi:hypothetical protein